jgi:transposase-like protein
MAERTRKRSAEEWRTIVAECNNSDLPRAVWCAKNGINPSSIQRWVSRFRQANNPQSANWVELKISEQQIKTDKASTVRFKINGATFAIDSSFDADLLARVVKVVATI